MRININDTYYVETDTYNFILAREKEIMEGEHKGEKRKEIMGYFRNIEELFYFMPKRLIREADACGLREIQMHLNRIERLIKTGLKNVNKECEKIMKERSEQVEL